jgi:hypothetical protein
VRRRWGSVGNGRWMQWCLPEDKFDTAGSKMISCRLQTSSRLLYPDQGWLDGDQAGRGQDIHVLAEWQSYSRRKCRQLCVREGCGPPGTWRKQVRGEMRAAVAHDRITARRHSIGMQLSKGCHVHECRQGEAFTLCNRAKEVKWIVPSATLREGQKSWSSL